MKVLVPDYDHRTGEHCASTALRNILSFNGVELSEPMIFGLASGLGFFYLRDGPWSPTRMFHGRTMTLEGDFCSNTAIPFEDREEPDNDRAWEILRGLLDAGCPVMVSTDTFYLGYQNTTSHFPGHRAVVVGYDLDAHEVYIADRKFEEYQTCKLDELRRSRNADDYPMRCANQYGDFQGELKLGRPLREAIRIAMRANCESFLAPADGDGPGLAKLNTAPVRAPGAAARGILGLRALATDFAEWRQLEDWSWAARFGYQIVIKRGAGGSFFRSLYADFLAEAGKLVPAIEQSGLPKRMAAIAGQWRDLAAVLKEQSERETCAPELFELAGDATGRLADEEESFFRAQQKLVTSDTAWNA